MILVQNTQGFKNMGAVKLQSERTASVVSFPDQLDIDENRMAVTVPFADGSRRDGVGDVIEVGGIDFSRHQRNPVVLWEHGKANVSMPIAMAEDPETKQYTVVVDEANRMAKGKAFFYQGNDAHGIFCEQLFHLICKKFIRGGSIGYQIVQANPIPPDMSGEGPPVQGMHLIKTMMLEYSVVVIPANGDTVLKSANWLDWRERAREILCQPSLCGKSLALPLRKSLEPYAAEGKVMSNGTGKAMSHLDESRGGALVKPPQQGTKDVPKDTESPVNPPLTGNLSETNVPPARWKPGVGAEQMKKIRAKYKAANLQIAQVYQNAARASAQEIDNAVASLRGMSKDDLRQTLEEMGFRVRPSDSGPAIAKEIEKYIRARSGASQRMGIIRLSGADLGEKKSINVRFKRKVVKGYASVQMKFDVSGMDTKRQNQFVKEMKDCGFGHPSGGRWSGEGDEKALDAPLKTANYAFDLEPGKNLAEAIGKAQAVGEKHGAKYLGNTKGMTIETKSDQPAGKVSERRVGDVGVGAYIISALGSGWVKEVRDNGNSREYILDTGKNVVRDRNSTIKVVDIKSIGANMKTKSADGQLPEEVPVEEEKAGPAEFHLKESLGSQVLKRFHEDHSALMQQYDEILPVLDHSDVKAFLEEKLKGWEKDLSHVEKSHKKWFKDVEPIAGSMEPDEYEEKDHLPGEIDNAAPADSDPSPEPSPDEAMEGMDKVDEEETPEEKALRIKQTKSIRAKYRGKGGSQDLFDRVANWISNRINDSMAARELAQEILEGRHGSVPSSNFGPDWPPFIVSILNKEGYKSMTKDLTDDEAEVIKDDMVDQAADVDGVKWFKGLAEHQQGHVTEAKGYLKELGETPDEGFTHEHRMKAYHHGTNLEGLEGKSEEVVDEVAGDVPVDGTKGLVLSRQEYDSLVANHPDFMRSKYPTLKRDWNVDGVQVSGDPAILAELTSLLGKSMTKDLTENEAEVIKDEMVDQADDTEAKSLRKAVKDAAGYLKGLSGAERFSEDERQKAMSLCKDLDEIEAEEKAEEEDDVTPEAEGAMQTKAAEEIEELKEKALSRSKQMDELSQSLKRLEGLVSK